VDTDTLTVLFNAVPLLLLAALYFAAGAAVLPAVRRERVRLRDTRVALALVFPLVGLLAAVLGIGLLLHPEPLVGELWASLLAIVIAAVPAIILLSSWADRRLLLAGARIPLENLAGVDADAADRLSRDLARAADAEAIGSLVADESIVLFGVDVAALALVDPDGRTARFVAAREGEQDLGALKGLILDLERPPSGVAKALRDEAPFAVGDATTSPAVSKKLERVGVRSAAFVPVFAASRAVGVLVLGTRAPRSFEASELAVMQDFASQAGLALARATASVALADALERERLVSRISLEVRSRHDLEDLLGVTVAETASAIDAIRCFIRLGETASQMEVVAEWDAPGVSPLGEATRLPAVNLAARERRTVAVADVLQAPELQDPSLGDVGLLVEQEVRAVLATPLLAGEQVLGVLGIQRSAPSVWSAADIALAEAVAREAATAIETARLLRESEKRLAEQSALLKAGQQQARSERGFYRIAAMLSEPLSAHATLGAVAQAAAESLEGDAAAVLRPAGGTLELAASHGLPEPLAEHLRSGGAQALASCARAGKVLASGSLAEDSRFADGLAAAAEAAGCRSLLAVPLPQPRGAEPGLALVFFGGERSFTDQQLELAGHVAGAARGALERSELYELERRSRSLAQRLATASRELSGELDPENVLEDVARHAVDLLEADAASVRLLEDDELVVRAACGAGANEVGAARVPSTTWLVGDIVQARAGRAISDATGDARAAEADPILAAAHAAYLGVPMIAPDDSVHGVLAVYSRRPREWREEESGALQALAGSAAAARTTAELYQGVKHEQQRSEAILANVADGIVAVDRDGEVVLWNQAAERITGVPATEALGRTPAAVLGRTLEADASPGGRSGLVPIRRGPDEVWLSLSEAVMTDPAGAVAGRIYAFRDISDERAVEQMKSDFVSTVSHELRTPLTSIYGFAETLLRQDVLFGEEERGTFLSYIASESERLTAIVDSLLSVAQLDAGGMQVQIATTDVAQVVAEAVRTAETAPSSNGHHFRVVLDEAPLEAAADREKLSQVLAHLLDNAVRYSPAGGIVTVGARLVDAMVEVRVEDEGIGISHAEQERIFRKFYRGEAAGRTVGSGVTGLGLFLAEGLVDAMGGRIWVESDEGAGSVFAFQLPAASTGRVTAA
jgi:two-component system phosphate regulon sensor histidine kinase PhoR